MSSRSDYFYIDLLRAVAAVAVVMIHVVGPYRHLLGQIAPEDWLAAVGYNVACRWAVPVFIMITGALLLSDTRPFNLRYYLSHRAIRVLVPFLAWSVLYAMLAGVSWDSAGLSYDLAVTIADLKHIASQPTWGHLGFYYYFIPLYFVIPFLQPIAQQLSDDRLKMLVLAWLALTTLYLMNINSSLQIGVIMYGGYLVLGYALIRTPFQPHHMRWLILASLIVFLLSFYGLWERSALAGKYAPGRYTSYKTLNTAIMAAAVFSLGYRYSSVVQVHGQRLIQFVAGNSLGLYLIHPLFLWPLHQWDMVPGTPLITVPLLTLVITVISLGATWCLSRHPITRWLVG